MREGKQTAETAPPPSYGAGYQREAAGRERNEPTRRVCSPVFRPLRRRELFSGSGNSTAATKFVSGFTLLELLIVIAILGLLAGILFPAVQRVKQLAKVARARAELHGLSSALLTYHEEHKAFPPARTYCEYGAPAKAADWAELPPELARGGYYAPGPTGSSLTLSAEDPFNPGRTYKYLKPGRGYHNHAGTYISLWIPDHFPYGDPTEGKDYSSEKDCPLSFVLWSVGTFGDIGYWNALAEHHPLDVRCWYGRESEEGLIVRACLATGDFVLSP